MALLIDAVKCLIHSDEDYNPESRTLNTELAEFLDHQEDLVVVVTNASGEKYEKIRDLLSFYKFETYTLEHHPKKTNPEYFLRLLAYYGLEPEECLYLDHLQENLESAGEVGIQGELYRSNNTISFLEK